MVRERRPGARDLFRARAYAEVSSAETAGPDLARVIDEVIPALVDKH